MTLKLLDGFCCQGGASMGYHQVGFVPYGIDINPQPHYPFPFHQGDVIQVLAALNAAWSNRLHAQGRNGRMADTRPVRCRAQVTAMPGEDEGTEDHVPEASSADRPHS